MRSQGVRFIPVKNYLLFYTVNQETQTVSIARILEFVNRCDLRSMERCMLNAFVYFGLVSKEVLTDNMEMVVTGREAGKVICPPILCLCRDGIPAKSLPGQETADQGEVERLVQYVKEDFILGLTFTDLEDLNQQALLRI